MNPIVRALICGLSLFAIGAPLHAADQELSFNIPSESLSDALKDYVRQTGRQVRR